MRRYGLRDDQWDRIKDLLPGREGHVGGTAEDNRLFVEAFFTDFERGVPGVICRSVSDTGKRFINALVDGRKAEFSSVFSSCWRVITITNT
jgi:hypothetical protein